MLGADNPPLLGLSAHRLSDASMPAYSEELPGAGRNAGRSTGEHLGESLSMIRSLTRWPSNSSSRSKPRLCSSVWRACSSIAPLRGREYRRTRSGTSLRTNLSLRESCALRQLRASDPVGEHPRDEVVGIAVGVMYT